MDRALIEDLSRPAAYSLPTRAVEQRQTHISRLFFTDSRVYKLKKPVDMGFLDFTTLERRRHFCEEEVRLNKRLAPDMYLGVVPVTIGEDGRHRIGGGPSSAGAAVDGAPETAVEWAVEMRRLPGERMLDVLLAEGDIDNDHLDELARLLVAFHAAARADEEARAHGSPAAVAYNLEENFEQTEPFTRPPLEVLSPALHAFLAERGRTWLAGAADLLERRVRAGHVREGHGDLHAGNICFADQILIYDCIEFSERLRCGDVACDLAFLAMDLDRAGFSAFGQFLVKRYAELAGDADLPALIAPYKVYRAVVRAKVACFAAAAADAGGVRATDLREAKRLEAMRYFHLAAEYELPRALVLTCGLPASGKSWIAKHIALPLDAALFASDVRRRSVAGTRDRLHPATYDAGPYAPDQKARVYDSLLESAREALAGGRSVVVDATFGRRARRAPFLALARELGAPCLVVHARADEATVRARMDARSRDLRAASQADMTVYLRAREDFEPPDEVPDLVEAWPDRPIEAVVAGLVEARLP